MVKQQYQAYKSATHTVAKTKQVVMLYEGVIRYVQQAKEAIQENRIEDRYHLLVKASDIIAGLQGALDFEGGGNVAAILYNYYSSLDSKLFSIHRTNSIETCDDIIADLKQMRDVWYEIDRNETQGDKKPPNEDENTGSAGTPPTAPSGITLSA